MNKIHIKFQLRKDRANKNGYYPIYLYANVNGTVKYFSLNHFVPLKAWNEKKQEVSVTFPNWNTINDDIVRYGGKAVRMRIAADEAGEMISLYQFEKVFRAYREISVIPFNNLPENPVDLSLLKGCTYYSHVEKPVFFGHYLLNGDPQLIKSNICYPDYSVAKYGCLAAYSFDRKKEQSGEKFTFV